MELETLSLAVYHAARGGRHWPGERNIDRQATFQLVVHGIGHPPSQQRRQLRGSAQKIKINTNRKIIFLDQLRQSTYRNKAEAFFCGKAALKLCFEGAIQKKDRRLTPIQRVFFYMSLQHAKSKKSAGEIQ
jgi:hypothetical protein